MHNLKSDTTGLTSQIASAQDRIAHLESLVYSLERGGGGVGVPNHDTSSPTITWPRTSSSNFPTLAKNILSVRSTALTPVFGAVPMGALQPDRLPSTSSTSTYHQTAQPYPPYQVALQAVETFFICNAISYPFLDKQEFLRDMDEAYAGRGEEGKEFVLFMVIAVGTTNRERLGEVERGASKVFRGRALMGLSVAVAREDIVGGAG